MALELKKKGAKWLKLAWNILKDSVSDFLDKRCVKLSAALSYYTVFSLPPMLIIVISIGSFFYKQESIREDIFRLIAGIVGSSTAGEIQDVLDNLSVSGDNVWATALGVGMLIFSATGIFGEVQDSINFLWGLKTKDKKGWIRVIINRLISFSMIIILGFILLVSLTVNTVLDMIVERLHVSFSSSSINFIEFIDQGFIFAVTCVLFTLIFKILPDAVVKWKYALAGGALTSVLFMIGKYFIGLYLTDTSIVSAYGATGSIIIMLLWVYYSSIILYFGAVFTLSVVSNLQDEIVPNRYAVRA